MGGTSLLYDADGNLTNLTDASGTTVYQYDAENRLVSVATPTNGTWQYTYDGLGQRIVKTSPGDTQHFLLDPVLSEVAASYDGTGELVSRYDNGIGLISREDPAGHRAYFSYDKLGNSRELTDDSGAVLNRYDYDAFGATTLASETVTNEVQFVGRFGVTVEPNQLIFMKNRYYSPGLGRFMTEDPIRTHGGLNLLRYVGNNPVSHIDPLGLEDPMIGLSSSRGEIYQPGGHETGASIKTLDVNVSAAAGQGATADLIVTSDGVHVAGGVVVYGEGLGGSASISTSDTTEGDYIGVSIAAPGGTVSVSFPDDGQTPKQAIDRVVSQLNGSSTSVGLYAGSPGITVSRYHVSSGVSFDVGYAFDFYADNIANLLMPRTHKCDDFLRNPQLYFSHPSMFFELKDDTTDDVVLPGDPNDKTGPLGFGPNGLVSASSPLAYTITFVNASSNSAPAHTISITDQLDSNLDPRTLRLTEIVFGVNTIQVPPNRSFLQTNLTLITADGPVQASVIAGVDIQSSRLFWSLTAIDPATGQSPLDPLLGLLPPDDTNHVGEGRVSYTVAPFAGLPTGTSITNAATIIFDNNPPITTPAVINMLDAGTPQSQVTVSNNVSQDNTFIVSWSGTDNNGESGLAGYDVFVSDNGGPFQIWLGNTTLTSAPYTGQPGHTYSFYSIATDNAGNVQATGSQPAASVFVSTNLPPVIQPIGNVTVPPGGGVTVRVKATDPNGDQLTYSLAVAPAGASIRSTNGLFRWQATRNFAETTNLVTVVVTDNGVPPLSANATFAMTVLDYLELSLGSTNLEGGQSSSIPVYLASSDGVTNLLFTVQVPEDRLTNWTLTATSPQIASATLEDFTTNILISLSTISGQSLQGTQQISQLNFRAVTNGPSSFINLPVTGITGIRPDASPYSYYTAQPGLVVVVQDQPLLQAIVSSNLVRNLSLYGKLGTNYELQFTTDLASASLWETLLDYTQTNGVIKLGLDSTNPVIFYRLLQQ